MYPMTVKLRHSPPTPQSVHLCIGIVRDGQLVLCLRLVVLFDRNHSQHGSQMKFAYADPPYLGCSALYVDRHPLAMAWDEVGTHRDLIRQMALEYPDGWAFSMSASSIWELCSIFPSGCRWAAWCKPFASFKPNVNPAYTWEPVVFRGGRKRDRTAPTVRDSLSCNITLKKGLTGAKPAEFCEWILDLLGFDHTQDTLDDLFPGTGIMGEVIAGRKCDPTSTPLFASADS